MHVLAEQYRLISRIAALDVSDEWAADGAASCAHWVAAALDTEVSTAREWVRIGRALRVLDEIDAAFAAGRPVVQQGARTHKSCDSRDAGRVIGIGRTRPGGWARSRVGGLADAAGDPSRNRGSTGSEDGVVVERRRRRDGCADGAAPTRRDGVRPGGGRGAAAGVAAGRVRGRVPTVAVARPPACQRVPRAVPSRLRWRDRRGRAPCPRRRLHDGRRFPGGRIRRSPHCADRLPAGADSRRGGSSDQCFGPTPKSNDAATACRTRTRSALCRLRRDRPPRVRPRPGMGAER